eukprot:jgi/Tetstr1/464580/TSEL_009336.t1
MRLPLGTAITVRFGDLTDAAKKVWVAAHPGEPVAGVTLRGVICGHSGAWHRVTFAKDHPETEREEVQAAIQQLLDAFADADAEPAGDSAEPDEYPAAPTPRPVPTELPPPDWEPASCYRCQREQARAYPPRSGHYRRNHSEAAHAGVAWHFWQCVVPFSVAEFKVFLAVLLAMTIHSTVSLEELWDNPAVPSIKALPTRYGFAALMTQRRFNEWRAYFRFWGHPGDLPDSQYSETCQDWVEALNDNWYNMFAPSTILCLDETVFQWITLCGNLHLTWLPNKPHPMGWMLKTLACAMTGCIIRMELSLRKQLMALKPLASTYKATVAVTLRLTDPWWHTQRILVADSWFGSVATALELYARGIYSVMAVRMGHAGYPKQRLISAVAGARFNFASLQKEHDVPGKHGERCMVYASAWQDTQPMLLVHTCCSDAITPPVERLKSKYKDGRVHKYRYEVEQQESHATCRQHFNAVDINNKLSVGPHSVSCHWLGPP